MRQLFAAGCIQSAYWHRFSATAHSPIGLQPGAVRHHAAAAAEHPRSRTTTWSFDDPTGTDHDYLGAGLRKALYNYMHGIGLDADVREWFEPPVAAATAGSTAGAAPRASVPRTTVPPNLIERFLG